ncbi:DUF3883 domain-containing protein [Streptomyces sp. NPDC018029]|uniref:DUF3883 domain-containing protein n=1 Tax=Streptomyces sp. NPDC018029 TaxID=3365032 RepID=UPI0037B917EA
MLLGEGTRRAAIRWLEILRIADVPRARTLFTHHPDYADLTPEQYAVGLRWLHRTGLLDWRGRPAVRVAGYEDPDSAAASRIAQMKWDESAEAARRIVGTVGEVAVLRLLKRGDAARIVHAAAVSDALGYDIEAESRDGVVAHLEVKATTDPTRLVIHLTRNEYEVMCRDENWLLVAVLIGVQEQALHVVTVDREWLSYAAPADRDMRGAWESVRYSVPADAMTPGLVRGDGSRFLPAVAAPFMPLWGMEPFSTVPSA